MSDNMGIALTDKEIIKALECHIKRRCWNNCPNSTEERQLLRKPCSQMIAEDALDLIKRQQAEIERLTDYNENLLSANTALSCDLIDDVKRARAEAIKEFAERLNAEMFYKCGDTNYTETCEARRLIDNLVKEMTEEEK